MLQLPRGGVVRIMLEVPGGASSVGESALRALMPPRSLTRFLCLSGPRHRSRPTFLALMRTPPCRNTLDIEIEVFAGVSNHNADKRSENKSTAATTVLVMLTAVMITLH